MIVGNDILRAHKATFTFDTDKNLFKWGTKFCECAIPDRRVADEHVLLFTRHANIIRYIRLTESLPNYDPKNEQITGNFERK